MPVDPERLQDLHRRDRLIGELRQHALALEARLATLQGDLPPLATRAPSPSLLFAEALDDLDPDDGPALTGGLLDLAASHARSVKYPVVGRRPDGVLVHPRADTLSGALLGPFDTALPDAIALQVRTLNAQAPPVAFHCSVVPADEPAETWRRQLAQAAPRPWWVVADAASGPLEVSAWSRAGAGRGWSLLLATRVADGGSVNFSGAAFCDLRALWLDLAGPRRMRRLQCADA